MGSRTTVHLIRHGEVYNPGGVLYGRLPGYRLSERGHRMAELTAAHMRENHPDVSVVYCSPLQRVQETTAPIAAAVGGEPVVDERVIEAGNYFEGLVLPRELRNPAHWVRLINPRRPSWGEAYEEIVRRMMASVRDARRAAEGAEAIIVSHQLPIYSTYLAATGKSFLHNPSKRRCGLASVTSLHFDGDDIVDTSYCEPAEALYTDKQRTREA